MTTFEREPLVEVIEHLRGALESGAQGVTIRVPDPDRGHGHYPGERMSDGARHRPLRVWTDLADRLELRLHTPRRVGALIELHFTPLSRGAPLLRRTDERLGKYSPRSNFSRVSKLEEPDFVLDMRDALERAALPKGASVLSLGVNTADELTLVMATCPLATCTGVDHDREALEVARERFPAPHTFIEADLGALPQLPRFDLVLCIDTLQSPRVDDRALLRHIVQDLLTPRGALILGLPNCRHLDGELVHGARMVNFRQPELSLLLKGVAFYKKYLQQHNRRVFITGKHELLITATPTGGKRTDDEADRRVV